MSADPEVLRALERTLIDDPGNRALRIHLVDLLLADGQHAAALGHCQKLLSSDPGDTEARTRATTARRHLGIDAHQAYDPEPTQPGPDATAHDAGPQREPSTPGADTPPINELFDIARPEVTLDDVAGMDDVKERLRLGFLEPLRNEELRRSFGQALRTSLLLWGPPGCGKTFLAKALAGELGLFFIHVGIADVLEMWIGSSERNLRDVFEEARLMSPTVLFIDELDALGHKRAHLHSSGARNVVNQLLLELDGATADNEGLLVLGATNQVWDIDPALLRPGRFDRKVVVLPPDEPARRAILAHHLQRTPVASLDLDAAAQRTEGFSGADLARVCTRATEFALHESVQVGSTRPLDQGHLERALADTSPSTDSWFRLAENYVQFADDGDQYTELARYLAARRGRGRGRRR